MASRKTKRTLRRTMPRSKTPLARELAELGNALQSVKLIQLAERVAVVESRAAGLDAFMVSMEQTGGEAED